MNGSGTITSNAADGAHPKYLGVTVTSPGYWSLARSYPDVACPVTLDLWTFPLAPGGAVILRVHFTDGGEPLEVSLDLTDYVAALSGRTGAEGTPQTIAQGWNEVIFKYDPAAGTASLSFNGAEPTMRTGLRGNVERIELGVLSVTNAGTLRVLFDDVSLR
jgi:hypothetical protein